MKTTLLALFLIASTFVFAQNKKWNCIDTNGNTLFTIDAKFVSDFSSGLAKVYQQNYVAGAWQKVYGFVNDKGEFVIPCIYADANDFADGLAWVQMEKDGIYTLINDKGEIIPTKPYSKVGYIIKGKSELIAVYENKKLGFINRKGEEVIPCKYLGSNNHSEGFICLCPYESESSKYGFFKLDGTPLTPFHFKQSGTSSFKNGLCRVNWEGKPAMIDTTGKVVFKTNYKSLQDFNFGLAAICTKSDRTGWGFVNLDNELVIAAEYDFVDSFNEDGLAVVEKNAKKGVIDTTGKIVIPLKYETVYCNPTRDGYICGVYKSDQPASWFDKKQDYFDSKFMQLDLTVKVIASANYGSIMKIIDFDKLDGYMNRNYEIIVSPQYKRAGSFYENKAWLPSN